MQRRENASYKPSRLKMATLRRTVQIMNKSKSLLILQADSIINS